MMKSLFEGTATALVTPFTKSGVDFRALDRILDFQMQGGVDALVLLGTTGEPATMTQAEKDAVLTFAVQKLKGKIPLIVGAGSNSTAQAVENCKHAEELGA
ncbi:MAG: dihydrodipicolinate synthase family protein, partial [Clostridia bacterium]|nr:dihydrodipicolinate synthase family protein [Clostridia bacterium]